MSDLKKIVIDGDAGDWNLAEFKSTVHGGDAHAGDTALLAFDGATLPEPPGKRPYIWEAMRYASQYL